MFTRRIAAVVVFAAAASLSAATRASASPINFVATGDANATGFIQFDTADFNGTSFQIVPNSEILDLALTIDGQTFDLADVIGSDRTVIDSRS